jgi:uncharacterized protein (DUF1697 family)
VRYVAFLRNVALGQARGCFSLNKVDLLEAFQAAGATFTESFLVSGNLVFEVASENLEAVVTGATQNLKQGGFFEPLYVRSLPRLCRLVELEPFTTAPSDNSNERCITFLSVPIETKLPLSSARGDVEVFKIDGLDAFSVTRSIAGRSGYATALLEAKFNLQATTRNWNTILRLVKRYGD